jgi:hypothetical protein
VVDLRGGVPDVAVGLALDVPRALLELGPEQVGVGRACVQRIDVAVERLQRFVEFGTGPGQGVLLANAACREDGSGRFPAP